MLHIFYHNIKKSKWQLKNEIIKFYNFRPSSPCDKNSSPSLHQITPMLRVPVKVSHCLPASGENVPLLSRRKLTESGNLTDEVRKSHFLRHGCFSVLRLGVISLTTWLHAYNLRILKLTIVTLKFYYPYYLVH